MQITPVTHGEISYQSIQKAVAEAQRRGIIWLFIRQSLIIDNSLATGHNHPARISQQPHSKSFLPSPSGPNPTSSKGQNTQKWSTSKETWPKRGSGSKQTSGHPNFDYRGHHSVTTRPIVVPKFISSPIPLQPGYQEAHTRYDEMRRFFAQKAFTVHSGEVVVIKVTMMSLKPGNKNPSIISVRETQVTK